MDDKAVLALFDRQMRIGGGGERVGAVVRRTGGEDDWNGVEWSALDESTADHSIAAQLSHFSALGLEFEWKLYAHDRPADLGGRLRAAGFVAEPEEALMVAEVGSLPTAVELPDGIHLRPVTDAAGVDLLADVHRQVFTTSPARLRHRLLAQLTEAPETISMVVAMAGDRPVCSARMELTPGTDFAGLWGGGTVPDWRGRGLYRALVAHRARLAAGLGYRFLQVDASDQSEPILRRLGFARLSSTTPYVWRP